MTTSESIEDRNPAAQRDMDGRRAALERREDLASRLRAAAQSIRTQANDIDRIANQIERGAESAITGVSAAIQRITSLAEKAEIGLLLADARNVMRAEQRHAFNVAALTGVDLPPGYMLEHGGCTVGRPTIRPCIHVLHNGRTISGVHYFTVESAAAAAREHNDPEGESE